MDKYRKIYDEAQNRTALADKIGKSVSDVIEPAIKQLKEESNESTRELIRNVVEKLEEVKELLKTEITIEI
jgi:gas vesicle protein